MKKTKKLQCFIGRILLNKTEAYTKQHEFVNVKAKPNKKQLF